MIKLALIRHGHTAWNRAGRIQGRSDIPLDAEAEAHLASLRLPAPWIGAALQASPLQRAMQTAHLISGRAAEPVPELIEMDWGRWEGLKGIELRADAASGFRDIENWSWAYRPPGGESPKDLRDRLIPWVNSLSSDTVAVCHIGVMRVLLAQATGWHFDGPPPFRIKRDRLFIIEISATGWRALPEPIRLERVIS